MMGSYAITFFHPLHRVSVSIVDFSLSILGGFIYDVEKSKSDVGSCGWFSTFLYPVDNCFFIGVENIFVVDNL